MPVQWRSYTEYRCLLHPTELLEIKIKFADSYKNGEER